jgi:excisionase family DNA binding protein
MQLLTICQAASRCAISARMIRKLIAKKELPMVRVGRCVRLREDDVEALVRRGYSGRSSPHDERSMPHVSPSSDDSSPQTKTTALKGGRNALR